ncbi:MAG: carbohydrate kinase family protein [Pirellulales bacterium]
MADHLCAPIPRLPDAGQLVLSDDLPLQIGGCASNAAMDLARLGVNVGVIGCVGQDPFGRFIIETLAAANVRTEGIRQLADVPTSGTLIINVQGQDRRFIHTIGANGRFDASSVSLDQVRQCKVFYVGGYLLMGGLAQEGLLVLFREARRSGVKTVLDVVLPGPGDHWARLDKLLSETDVFLPNTDEAAIITGRHDPVEQAQQFRDAGCGAAVITCGGQGTVLLTDQHRVMAGTYPTTFVGGTGAGDAFDAGYIAGLLAGQDPLGCLRWGSALGASCVRAIGATESVFTRPEAEAFLEQHELPLQELGSR